MVWIYCQRTQNFKKLLGRDTSYGVFLGTTMTKKTVTKTTVGKKSTTKKIKKTKNVLLLHSQFEWFSGLGM